MNRCAKLVRGLSAVLLLAARAYGTPNTCCERLKTTVSEQQVLTYSNSNYHIEVQKYWSSTAKLNPLCVFVPESPLDVSVAVKFFADNKCEFAIRGGGHTPNAGWAGTSSGVLVSLSGLTTVEVSKDKMSVTIGAGNRWGEVYTTISDHNITVAGGRIAKVGVSGFLLGGGLSYLMHSEGFSADTILSYEIVLANGEITTVTSESNSDLFKALKGGTGNFGVMTSFTMQAFPIRDVHAGFLFYAPDQYEKLYPIMETYAREGVEDDPRTHMIQVFASNPSLNIDMAGFYTFYSEPFDTPPAAIKPFFDLPTTHRTAQNKTAKEANHEVTEGFEDGIRYDMQTYSVRADARLFKQLVDIWRFATAELDSTVTGWSSRIVYQTISKNMIRASDKKGGNALGLQATGDPLVIVTYMFTWIRPEDDDKVYSGIDKLISTSTNLAESQNQLDDYIYLNYAGSGQKPIESYGLAQVKFLQRVKAKYDPEGVFEKLCRGGFKIPSQCSDVDDGYLNMQAGGSDEQTCSHFL